MQLGSRSAILLARDLRQALAHDGGRCMPQVRHPQPQPPPHKVYRSGLRTDIVEPVVDIVLVDSDGAVATGAGSARHGNVSAGFAPALRPRMTTLCAPCLQRQHCANVGHFQLLACARARVLVWEPHVAGL